MPATEQYQVIVFYKGIPVLPDIGFTFGMFEERDEAEACMIALATRADVTSATIEIIEVT